MIKKITSQFIVILVCLIVIGLSILGIQKIKTRSPAKESGLIDIWLVKSPHEELLCWGAQPICGWSWKTVKDLNVANSPITSAGMLQKEMPTPVIYKQKLISVPNLPNTYSPIDNYLIRDKYVLFTTTNRTYFTIGFSGDDARSVSTLYIYNRQTNELSRRLNMSEPMVVSSLSPNQENALIYLNQRDDNKFMIVKTGENTISSGAMDFDSFQWADNNKYVVATRDKCNTEKFSRYTCPVLANLINCDDYPYIGRIQNGMNDLPFGNDFVFTLPEGWDYDFIHNQIFATDNSGTVAYLDYSSTCDDLLYNPPPQKVPESFKVGGDQSGKFILLKSTPLDDGSAIVASGQLLVHDHYYNFELRLTGQGLIPKNRQKIINEFESMLKSAKINYLQNL